MASPFFPRMMKNRLPDPSEICAVELQREFRRFESIRFQRVSASTSRFSTSAAANGRPRGPRKIPSSPRRRDEQFLRIIRRSKAIGSVREVTLGKRGCRNVPGFPKAGFAGQCQHFGRREEPDEWSPADSRPLRCQLKPGTHIGGPPVPAAVGMSWPALSLEPAPQPGATWS